MLTLDSNSNDDDDDENFSLEILTDKNVESWGLNSRILNGAVQFIWVVMVTGESVSCLKILFIAIPWLVLEGKVNFFGHQ